MLDDFSVKAPAVYHHGLDLFRAYGQAFSAGREYIRSLHLVENRVSGEIHHVEDPWGDKSRALHWLADSLMLLDYCHRISCLGDIAGSPAAHRPPADDYYLIETLWHMLDLTLLSCISIYL